MSNIKTYGDLCSEIERVKKSIEEVKQGMFYEQGDEVDLELYLIHLEETKDYNEKLYEFKEEYGLNSCPRCGKHWDVIETRYNIEKLSYDYILGCNECDYKIIKSIDKNVLKDNWELFKKGSFM